MINLKLFREYFEYLSPSDMYNNLNKTTGSEQNIIKHNLANLKEEFKCKPTSDGKAIKNRNSMLNIVELILEFNQLNQLGKDLNILTPSQLLSRLPISLAQLKAGNNSEKLKNEIGNYCILCTDQKNLQNNSIKVRSTLFKAWKRFS